VFFTSYSNLRIFVRIIGENIRTALWVGLSKVEVMYGTVNVLLVLTPGYEYDGILVAFLVDQNPLAIILVAIVLGGITSNASLLKRAHHLPDATVLFLQGIIFLLMLLSETWYGRLQVCCDQKVRA
jgi:simple sugar transport system permease protein